MRSRSRASSRARARARRCSSFASRRRAARRSRETPPSRGHRLVRPDERDRTRVRGQGRANPRARAARSSRRTRNETTRNHAARETASAPRARRRCAPPRPTPPLTRSKMPSHFSHRHFPRQAVIFASAARVRPARREMSRAAPFAVTARLRDETRTNATARGSVECLEVSEFVIHTRGRAPLHVAYFLLLFTYLSSTKLRSFRPRR